MLKIFDAADHTGQRYITGIKVELPNGEIIDDNAVTLVKGEGIDFQSTDSKLTIGIEPAWKGVAIEEVNAFPAEPKEDIIYKLQNKLYYYSNEWIEIPSTGDISSIASSYQQHILDMSSHVTVAEKALWNNKEHLVEVLDILPEPSASYSGKCIFLTSDNGETNKYKIYRCMVTGGNEYTWVDTSIGTEDYGDMFYGWIPSTVSKYKVKDLIQEDIISANTIVIKPDIPFSLGENPKGALLFVAIPASFNGAVYKNNGGQWDMFDEDNGIIESGANNYPVMIDGIEYRLYGEFSIVSGETCVNVVKN